MSFSFYEKLQELLLTHQPVVKVTMVDAVGSVPQDLGAKMLVTSDGLYCGTVGGGKVEKRALEEAAMILSTATCEKSTRFVSWNLSSDIGMTCGGSVKLFFEAFNVNPWQIVIFGAGHVSQALVRVLLPLDCQITCYDPRPLWLEKMPSSPRLRLIQSEQMPEKVVDIPEDAFVVLMTMGHSSDKPILLEILKTRQFPYLGVIGSRAKAVRLKQDVLAAGLPVEAQEAFYCPIGLTLGTNHPQEIAISVVAQLLQVRDQALGTHKTHR